MTATPDSVSMPESCDRDPSVGGIMLARRGLNDDVRKLSTVSDVKGAWAIARQWLVISTAIAAAVWSGHWAVYIAAAIVVATRQHALGIIMHDATHYRIFSSRSVNDFLCDLFCSFPIGMTTARYRYEHNLHHRFTNTDGDPYWLDFKREPAWHWPKTPKQALWVFVRDCLGLNLSHIGPAIFRWSPWSNHFGRKDSPPPLTIAERARLYAFLLVVGLGLTLTHGWVTFLLLWQLPLMTITVALIRMRTVAEHLAIPNEHELNATRHVDGTLLERLSISPLNINYHLAHHLFPSVPFYNLPKLHALLLKNERYRQHAHFSPTYLSPRDGVLSEMLSSREGAADSLLAASKS